MSVSLGLARLHPSAADDKPHYLGFSTARTAADDGLLEVWNGATDAALVFRVNLAGQVQVPNGSASAPAFVPSGDKDTGIHFVTSTPEVGIGIAGSKVLSVVAAGAAVTGTFAVSGTSTLTGAATLASTLAVTGAATLSNTLAVAGATTLSSTLGVTGNFAVNTTAFTVAASSGNTAVGGALSVAGASTLTGAVTAGADVIVDSGNKVRLDGNASGDSYLYETSNVVYAVAGSAVYAFSTVAFYPGPDGSRALGAVGHQWGNFYGVNAILSGTLALTGAATLSSTLAITGKVTASSTIELGHASDTTLARIAAGRISVEGVEIATASNTLTLTNKSIVATQLTGTVASARISGSYTGITGVGTIAAGTWQGDAVGVAYGGTGLASFTAGDILYATGATTLAKLAKGTGLQILRMNSGATAPEWTDHTDRYNIGPAALDSASMPSAGASVPFGLSVAVRAGSITGISARFAASSFGAGNLTVEIYKNGVATGLSVTFASGGGITQIETDTQAVGAETVAAGDYLQVVAIADGSYAAAADSLSGVMIEITE